MGGEMSIYEKEWGAKPCVHVQKHIILGRCGGMLPQKIFDFRLSETASGTFSATLY